MDSQHAGNFHSIIMAVLPSGTQFNAEFEEETEGLAGFSGAVIFKKPERMRTHTVDHFLQGFSTIPGGDRRISEPSTVAFMDQGSLPPRTWNQGGGCLNPGNTYHETDENKQ